MSLAWSSSSSAASINTNGLATGLTNGVTTIMAAVGTNTGSTTLTVVTAPVVLTTPTNITASPDGNVTLTVSATGGSLSYQWQLNGTNLAGATDSALALTHLTPDEAGTYSVIVSNLAGAVTNQLDVVSLLGLDMYAGLTIVGKVGGNYEIDYTTNLQSNMTVLTNIILPASPYVFIDLSSPAFPRRFYRAILVQ